MIFFFLDARVFLLDSLEAHREVGQEVRSLRLEMILKRGQAANQGDSKGSGRQAGQTPHPHQPCSRETDMKEVGKLTFHSQLAMLAKGSAQKATLHRSSSGETALPLPSCLLLSTFCLPQMCCGERFARLPAAASPDRLFSS